MQVTDLRTESPKEPAGTGHGKTAVLMENGIRQNRYHADCVSGSGYAG